MSQLYVDNIRNRTGGPIGIPTGAVVTGVLTATTGNITGNLTVGGVLTYEDVTNVDSVGIITARSGIEFGASGVGGTITATGSNLWCCHYIYLLEMVKILTGVASTDNIITGILVPPLLISIQPVLLVQPLLRATSYWSFSPTFLTK